MKNWIENFIINVVIYCVLAYIWVRNLFKRKEKVVRQPKVYKEYKLTVFDLKLGHLINEFRVLNGLRPIVMIGSLCNIAGDHCEYLSFNCFTKEKMQTNGHDFFQQRAEEYRGLYLQELVGYNYRSASATLKAFELSPKHKAALLSNRVSHIGIANMTSVEGKRYVTVELLGS